MSAWWAMGCSMIAEVLYPAIYRASSSEQTDLQLVYRCHHVSSPAVRESLWNEKRLSTSWWGNPGGIQAGIKRHIKRTRIKYSLSMAANTSLKNDTYWFSKIDLILFVSRAQQKEPVVLRATALRRLPFEKIQQREGLYYVSGERSVLSRYLTWPSLCERCHSACHLQLFWISFFSVVWLWKEGRQNRRFGCDDWLRFQLGGCRGRKSRE